MSLPAASANQATVQLVRLAAGDIDLPSKYFIEPSDPNEIRKCPSMSWLVIHPATGKKVVFDLGMRKDYENYPTSVVDLIKNFPVDIPKDVFDSLVDAEVDPQKDVDTVIISHLHWDHIGDPSRFGPSTKFIVGPGALNLITGPQTFPENPAGEFDSRLLNREQTTELPPVGKGSWTALGPFTGGWDLFGDGSAFIIDAAGHLPGHINLLARVEPEKWVYLAGDSAHHPALLAGTAEIADFHDPETGAHVCLHVDKKQSKIHMGRLRQLKEMGVEVILAHDKEWMDVKANLSRFKNKKSSM